MEGVRKKRDTMKNKKSDASEALLLQMPAPITNMSQATELLKAQKMMVQVQEELNQCKEQFHERMRKCREREEELAKKQETLRESVTRFSVFMKENDAKRNRANKKAQEEIKQREAKVLEIQKLQDDLEKRKELNTKIQQELEHGMVYQKYLESVVESADHFHEIDDVLKKHEELSKTESELRNVVDENNRNMDDLRKELAELAKDMQNQILVQNSEISMNQKTLEEMKLHSAEKEQRLIAMEAEAKDRIRKLGESRMAILNLHSRCVSTSAQKRGLVVQQLDPSEVSISLLMDHLKFIERRMKDLDWIVKNYKPEHGHGHGHH